MRWKISRKSSRYKNLWWRNRGKNVELPWSERLCWYELLKALWSFFALGQLEYLLHYTVLQNLATSGLGGLELPSISNSNRFSLDMIFNHFLSVISSLWHLEVYLFPLRVGVQHKNGILTQETVDFVLRTIWMLSAFFLKCLSTLPSYIEFPKFKYFKAIFRRNKTYSALRRRISFIIIRGRNRQFKANFPPYWFQKAAVDRLGTNKACDVNPVSHFGEPDSNFVL